MEFLDSVMCSCKLGRGGWYVKHPQCATSFSLSFFFSLFFSLFFSGYSNYSDGPLLTGRQCTDLKPAYAAIRNRLQDEYDEAFTRLEDQLFAQIGDSPPDEARRDEQRFVAKYFLDAQGRPDRTKTKYALCFAFRESESEGLQECVGAVPGLAIHLSRDYVVVGWQGTLEPAIEFAFKRFEEFYTDPHRPHRPYATPRISSHCAQANLHPDIFLRLKLGINTNMNGGSRASAWTVGRTRPSAPILLNKEYLYDANLPDTIINNMSNLFVISYQSTTVIGWDPSKVKAEVQRVRNVGESYKRELKRQKEKREKQRERKEAEKQVAWDLLFQHHRELVAQQEIKSSTTTTTAWEIEQIIGSYIVRWRRHGEDMASKDYRDVNNDPASPDFKVMRINIFSCKSPKMHGVKASFWFGALQGTMLLAKSKRELQQLRVEQPQGHNANGDLEGSYDDNDGEENEDDGGGDGDGERDLDSGYDYYDDDEQESDIPSFTNREVNGTDSPISEPGGVSLKDIEEPVPVAGQKRRSEDISDPEEPAVFKRQRVEAQIMDMDTDMDMESPEREAVSRGEKRRNRTNRVYFQFVAQSFEADSGRHSEGESEALQVSSERNRNRHIGYLDFDKSLLAAKGRFFSKGLCHLSRKISVYKVSETPNEDHRPGEWNSCGRRIT